MSKAIIEAARNAGLDVRSYSGRAMYGRTCLGIDCDRDYSPIKAVCDIIKELISGSGVSEDALLDCIDALEGAKTDSMGLGQIVYWPDIEWVEEESTDCPSDCGEGCECLDCPNCFKKASE